MAYGYPAQPGRIERRHLPNFFELAAISHAATEEAAHLYRDYELLILDPVLSDRFLAAFRALVALDEAINERGLRHG